MISAVLADDSTLTLRILTEVLEKSDKIRVVGLAKNGLEAIRQVKALKPDILILDCEMPVMNGLEALRKIMAENPLPVFIFSSLAYEGASVTVKALEYGAVDFFPKPVRGAQEFEAIANELIQKIIFIVLKSKFARLEKKESSPAAQTEAWRTVHPRKIDLIAMGSSTGGVQAAINIIPKLPKGTKPIVWVQHMPAFFTKSFAERLDGLSKMNVREAKNGDRVEEGVCLLAPGGVQMRLKKDANGAKVVVGGEEKVSGHCPSCDVLFESVAQNYSDNALGVILTGMGEDGKQGLVKMHDKGAFVIGQDPASCVVYGMSRAAFLAGAVDVQCDIRDVASAIKKVGKIDE